MTAQGTIASARYVLRVQRRQRAIVVARWPRGERNPLVQSLGSAAVVAARAAVPAWVVYAAWQKAQATSELSSMHWGMAAAFGVVVASGHLFQTSALSFSAREVLFLPDKASVLLARLLRALPVLSWIGGAWATAMWLCLRDEWPRQPIAVAAACVVAALAPFARSVAVLLQRLVAPDARSVLTPALLVALCTAYLTGPAQWTGDIERMTVTWTVLVLALLPLAGLVDSLWNAARASRRGLWLDLVRAPRTIVVLALVAPPAVWRNDVWLPLATCLGVASVCVLMPIALRRVLRTVNFAEAETRGGPIEAVGQHDELRDTRVARPTRRAAHRGRSPWRATWRLHWLQHGITRRQALRPWSLLPFLTRHGLGVAAMALAVWIGSPRLPPFWLVGALLVPVSVALVSRERLHLLGMDLREQARQQVTTALFTAAGPCLLAGTLVATLRGWTEQRVLFLAAFAATFLMRIGWRGWLRRPELASANGALVATMLIALSWYVTALLLPVERTDLDAEAARRVLGDERARELMTQTVLVQWPIVAGATAIALFGLVRRIALWREPELLADLINARERESRPTT